MATRKSAKTSAKKQKGFAGPSPSKSVQKRVAVQKVGRNSQITEAKVKDLIETEVEKTVRKVMVDVLKEYGLTKAPAKERAQAASPSPSQARAVGYR